MQSELACHQSERFCLCARYGLALASMTGVSTGEVARPRETNVRYGRSAEGRRPAGPRHIRALMGTRLMIDGWPAVKRPIV